MAESWLNSKSSVESPPAIIERQRVRLLLSYDGTEFNGWQKQIAGVPTIQGSLEESLSRLFSEPIHVIGSGRTDAGVHALGQVAHFDTLKKIENYQFLRAANSLLPKEIVIHRAWKAPFEFHARTSATHKTYHYWVLNRPTPSALRGRYLTWIPRPLSLSYLNDCSQLILGSHDFSSFRTAGTVNRSCERQIIKAHWTYKRLNLLCFSITGTGFLKQMVRNLVGTMLDLYFSGRPASDLLTIMKAKDRRKALGTARPEGLHLYRVFYPRDLDNKCRSL